MMPSLQDAMAAMVAQSEVVVYLATTIVTMDPMRPTAEAIAVADGRIVAVGTHAEVVAALGSRPFRVDEAFAAKVLVPGFIDQHVHPELAGMTMSLPIISMEDWVLPTGTVPAVRDRAGYRRRLAEAIASDSGTGTFFTWGFHHYFHGTLTRADLDAIEMRRPVVVWHRSAHEFILNTAALEHFAITPEFFAGLPDSVREQASYDDGHFWEQSWFAVLPKVLPEIAEPRRLTAGLVFVQHYLHAAGITVACEPGGIASRALQDAQNAVLGDRSTPVRFYYIPDGKTMAALHLDGDLIAETEKLLDWGAGMTSFLPRQVKLFADGAIFSQTMQMRDGYLDGHVGEWIIDPAVFLKAFRAYWDAGYQIHIHQNGDAGLDLILDCLEANMERNPRTDHRTTVVHFGFSTVEQVERIARLGAIVSANPYYLTALADRYSEDGIGHDRSDAIVRLADVRHAGVSLSLHSDMPMAPAQPLFLMWCAVNRTTFSGRVARPDLRISSEDALRAVTIDAAYSIRLEREVGSLEPGKRANVTVLEENPLTVAPALLKDIAIWGTILEGRVQPLGS
ncbi:MAG: amidohydrolase [Cellulomonadaceae bacterium]|nr:amidohydrolase [Cellulomonadaceae bacterium]